jgi:catechol 2,3-dioxygenase-like lactoylglutathione lyase family enzyme
MIDHIIINVKDIAASRAFYLAVLGTLGYEIKMEFPEGIGFGKDGALPFWISAREPLHTGVHVAFNCTEIGSVDAFHAAALAAGGIDNGAPGPREIYHPDYYGAFVLDPDGNNIEAVCHLPQA